MKKGYFSGMCIVMAAILLAACGKETKAVTDENNDQIINEISVAEEAEAKEEKVGDVDSVEEQVSEEEEELLEITGYPEDYEHKICSETDENEFLIGFNLPEGTWKEGSVSSVNGSADDNIYSSITFNQTESEDKGYLSVMDDIFIIYDSSMYIIDSESKMLVPNEKGIEEWEARYEGDEIIDISIEKKDSIDTVFGMMDIYYSEIVTDYDNGSVVSLSGQEWGVLPIKDHYVSIKYSYKEYSVSTNNSEWEQQSAQMEYQGKLKDIISQMFEVK